MTVPILPALLLLLPVHSPPRALADLIGDRRIVEAARPIIWDDEYAVTCEYRYVLQDGSTVLVISRYDPAPPGPGAGASHEAWEVYRTLLDQRQVWAVDEDDRARAAAREAAVRRPGDRRIVIVRDHQGRARRAGVVGR